MEIQKTRINELSTDKLISLAREIKKKKALASPSAGVRKDPQRNEFPLSYAQERLWIIEQLVRGTAVYNWPFAVPFEFDVNPDHFRAALSRLIARHEILRTTYALVDNNPVQRVLAATDAVLEYVDVSDWPDGADEAMRRIDQDARTPFDLSAGPFYRFFLFRIAPGRAIFAGTMHHSIIDAWSRKVLIEDLTAISTELATGMSSTLVPLSLQYGDYALQQREAIAAGALNEQMTYWRDKLAGMSHLELPTDAQRPSVPSFRGAAEEISLSRPLTESLRAIGTQNGATLFMVLMAGFMVLLSRYTGQADIASAIPIANRNRTELEGLIGFFVNTLILRVDVSGELSFREAVARVRQTAIEAYAHQDMPFELLVEELRPRRDLSRNPLVSVMFQLEEIPKLNAASAGFNGRSTEIQAFTSAFDMEVHLYETRAGAVRDKGDAIRGNLTYNSDIFSAASMRHFVSRYLLLLEGAAADPDCPVKDLPLLPERERYQVLEQWNETKKDYPSDRCIHELFEEQAAKTPDAVAVALEGRQLSYGELNVRANQFAHHLIGLGVKPDDRVVICMERSLEMVVGLLAVLKAGGCYVPLDPSYPPERLAYMLDDSSPAVLLTAGHVVERFAGLNIPLVDLTQDEGLWSRVSETNPDRAEIGLGSEHLAYVIYTSGSTGQPKGVMVEHRSVVNRLLWMQDAYALERTDVILQKTPFGFDVSVWEFFWPLLVGAKLVMARPEGHKDPSYLIETIQKECITTIHFVPSMLQVFLAHPDVATCSSLTRVVCSGESLPAAFAHRLYEELPSATLYNLYGPTEAAVDVTAWTCNRDASTTSIPIGRPIANTRIYILDSQGKPVPIGVSGELYIGGVQVARGYLNQPELTASRFLHDPFTQELGGRMYKTGDLARWRQDGNIEYLGRNDFQVKLRGFRIELGEIEARLAEQTEVRDAVVAMREDTPGDKRLVAYYETLDGQPLAPAALRSHLLARLPAYMVPAAYVWMAAMPLTANGKLARERLPAPAVDAYGSHGEDAPVGMTESLLAALWRAMFERRQLGRHDNFFELGGDSLLAMQLVYQAHQAGLEMAPSDVFLHQTVQLLAAELDARAPGTGAASPLVILQEGGKESPLFLVHPAGGMVNCYHELAQHLKGSRPIVGLAYRGFADQIGTDFVSVEAMAASYVAALQARWPNGPYLLGGWSLGGPIAHQMAHMLTAAGQEVSAVFVFDALAPVGGATPRPAAETSLLREVVGKIEMFSGRSLQIDAADLAGSSEEEQMQLVLARMKEQDLIPDHIETAALKEYLALYDRHVKAALAYVSRERGERLILLRATEVLAELQNERPELYHDPVLGWQSLSVEPVRVHAVPGNHLTMLTGSNGEAVAAALAPYLREGGMAPMARPNTQENSIQTVTEAEIS